MLKTIGLIIAMILAVVLTIAVCLGGFALVCVIFLTVWNAIRRLFFPAQDNTARINQMVLRDVPHFHRFQQAHKDAVTEVAALPDEPLIISTARDNTMRVGDMEWNKETTSPLPFYPGPLAMGDHENNGVRVALGVFKRASDETIPSILVWEPMVSASNAPPRFTLFVPGLCLVHALAWDDAAETLRVFVGVFDPSRPAVPNRDTDEPNALQLLQWDLRTVDGSGNTSPPKSLPLPPEFDRLSPWEYAKEEAFALSPNGLFLACQTEFADPQGVGGFGVGVWDVNEGTWRHRFGGREAYPHKIWAVSRSGEQVYSARYDEPRRDYRNGGQEWYDGLYIWDAHTSPPEGQKEAAPFTSLSGGNNMVFTRDETRMANPTGPTGDVEIYDMQTKTRLQTVTQPTPKSEKNRYGHTVWCCTFCDNDRQLVTGHADGQLWWWNVSSNDEKRVNTKN